MLPYFRGMEAFSISQPKSWSELSDQQLFFFFRRVARDLPMNEVLALAFANGLNLLCFVMRTNTPVWSRTEKANVKWCLPLGKSPLLRDNSRESFAPKPVRISVICGASAVNADLQAVPFEDYLACENYYQGFLHTQSMECLAEMAHLLYPKLLDKVCLENAELLSVFYWFASVKANFTRMFPHLTSSLFCTIT